MKNRIRKLFAAVLALSMVAALCPVISFAADEATTPAQMYFDKTYQAWWTALPGSDIVYEKSADVTTSTTAQIADSNHRNAAYFGAEKVTARPKAYTFEATDAYLLINLPQKENYELKTVEVTASHKSQTYQRPFDYYYSTDGTQWTKVETTTYTNNAVATTQNQYYYNFCETIKVPSTATKFKVQRNSNNVTAGSYFGANPTVMGFEFGYMPVTTNDVLQFSASCDTEMIDLFASGIIADGACDWYSLSYDYDGDGTAENGFGPTTGKSITINAVDGYKITSMSGKFYSNSASNKVKITLGEANKTVSWTQNGTTAFNVSNEEGAATLVIADTSAYSTHSLYDIVITMEKVITGGTVDVHGTIPQQNAEGVTSLGNINYSMIDDAKDNGDGTYTNYTDSEQTTLVKNAIATYTADTNCNTRVDAENFSGLVGTGSSSYAIFKAPQDAYIQNFDCYIRYIGENGPNKRLRLSVAESLDGPWIDVDSTWKYVTKYTSNDRGVNIYRQKTTDGVKLNAKYLKIQYPTLNYSGTSITQTVLGAFKYDWTVEKEANTYAQSGTLHIGGTENPYWIADTTDNTSHRSRLADYTDKKAVGMQLYTTDATVTVTEEEFAAGNYVGKPIQAGEEVFRGVYSGSAEPGGFVTVQAPDDAIATKATFHLYIIGGNVPDIAVWTSDTIDGEYTEVETTIKNLGSLAGMNTNHYIYALTADNLKNARFIKIQLNYGSDVKLGAIDIDYTRVGMPCIFNSSANDDSTYTVTATNYTVNDADCKLIVAQYDTDNKENTLAGVEIVDNIKIAGRGSNVKTITPVSGADKISVMAIDAKTNKPLANPIVIYPGE